MDAFFDWKEKQEQGKAGPANPENEALDRIWQASAAMKAPPPLDMADQWAALRQRIAEAETHTPPKRASFLSFLLQPAGGAVLVLVVLAAIGLYVFYPTAEVFQTQRGQQTNITLADGSTVNLNAASKLTVASDFETDKRAVRLEGEAYFEVTPNSRPFIITTDFATVKVLGTRFNVYARNDKVKVGVNEGKVSVSSSAAGETHEVILVKGQTTAIERGGFPTEPGVLTAANFPAWRAGRLFFEGTSLREVCDEIERFFDVEVHLGDPSLAGLKVEGLFTGDDPESTIAALCLLIQREHTYEDGTFLIR